MSTDNVPTFLLRHLTEQDDLFEEKHSPFFEL